ncbi:phytanoyl-CoA dioxygenase family protein [Polychaeton citri CBS 116435]|uniref:Phytanoyl-CoA dioxygenase family protein n=1 Tax=Polychaeton citri CBS 116435 TaxID=1314669 RepID=A0A9P4UQ15_9PEZI|nr:phytanoyl-CoA dioxygenase family protein [Polychaeton citri CBS 116435]
MSPQPYAARLAEASSSHEELRTLLGRDGFVKIPSVLQNDELRELRNACQDITAQARAGRWPYVRTLPKQFPPWNDNVSHGIWGVQHLLHPDQPNQGLYAWSYFHETVVDAVTGILACERDELVMELYNLLVRPDDDFTLRWHRDDIGPEVPPDEELRRLQEPMLHAQWNLALYDDESLVVVAGSHKRARTDEERSADPYEPVLSGQQVVKMKAGDIVFYNNNILHRGAYKSDVERMTLHGSMGLTSADPARARNILQHGIGEWADKCSFIALDASKVQLAEAMKESLIRMGTGDSVGYSQRDVL